MSNLGIGGKSKAFHGSPVALATISCKTYLEHINFSARSSLSSEGAGNLRHTILRSACDNLLKFLLVPSVDDCFVESPDVFQDELNKERLLGFGLSTWNNDATLNLYLISINSAF